MVYEYVVKHGLHQATPMLTFVFLLQENLVLRPLADCHIALNHTAREPTELAYPSTM